MGPLESISETPDRPEQRCTAVPHCFSGAGAGLGLGRFTWDLVGGVPPSESRFARGVPLCCSHSPWRQSAHLWSFGACLQSDAQLDNGFNGTSQAEHLTHFPELGPRR